MSQVQNCSEGLKAEQISVANKTESSFADEHKAVATNAAKEPEAGTTASVTESLNLAVRKKKKLLNGPHVTYTYPSGSTYVGGFRDGKLHGYGVYTYVPNGDRYEGEWRADMKHGHGLYVYANGDTYKGEWYLGKKNGRGRFLFANGDEYTGSWKDDVMDGYGVFVLSLNGSRYEGYWSHGVRHGTGMLRSGNGDVYDGEWNSGKESGFGILCQVNDDAYCGGWLDGLMEGKGIQREKGILYFVEYIGGYIISKIPVDDCEEVEEGWKKAFVKYNEWADSQSASGHWSKVLMPAPQRRFVTVDVNDQDMDAMRAENAVLRKRIESLLKALDTSTNVNNDRDSNNDVPFNELKGILVELQTKVALLESSLAEKMLDQRRLKDRLHEKEALLTDWSMRLEEQEETILKLKRRCRKVTQREPSTMDEQPSFEYDVEEQNELTEMEDLKQQNVYLATTNLEIEKKLTFLSSENAKLMVQISALEDQNSDLIERMEQKHCEGKNDSSGSVDDQRNDTTAGHQPSEPVSPPSVKADQRAVSSEDHKNDVISLQEQLRRINQLNAELTLHSSNMQKELDEYHAHDVDTSGKPNYSAVLRKENSALKAAAEKTQKELVTTQKELEAVQERLRYVTGRYNDLEEQVSALTKKKSADPAILKSIESKMERITTLEKENAELVTMLDETRAQLDEEMRTAHQAKKRRMSSNMLHGHLEAENDNLSKELKKTQKKLKKTQNDRNTVALDLYNTQLRLARADRGLQMIEGAVVVAVRVARPAEGCDSRDLAVSINESDTSQIVAVRSSGSSTFQFDYCFHSEVSSEALLAEVRWPISMVWLGFQAAFLTIGEARSGKSSMLQQLLPTILEYLGVTEQRHIHTTPEPLVSVTYKVAVVEVSAAGGYDCVSGAAVNSVLRDDHGYIVPTGATSVRCTGSSIMSLITKSTQNRKQKSGRSHMWIQVQCITTHKVKQTCTVGRLTFLDMCGGGPITANAVDMENDRFANRSFQAVKDILYSLRDGYATVPYTQTLATTLLAGMLGGNSFTTVLGAVRPESDHLDTSIQTLGALDCLSALRNGPLLQDFTGADTLRWREIVSALSSEQQASQQLVDIDDTRST